MFGRLDWSLKEQVFDHVRWTVNEHKRSLIKRSVEAWWGIKQVEGPCTVFPDCSFINQATSVRRLLYNIFWHKPNSRSREHVQLWTLCVCLIHSQTCEKWRWRLRLHQFYDISYWWCRWRRRRRRRWWCDCLCYLVLSVGMARKSFSLKIIERWAEPEFIGRCLK